MARYVEFPCPICYEETDFADDHICSLCVADRDKQPQKYFVLNVVVEND